MDRLFIGSASERLDVAYAVQENLERDCEVTVWTQGVFELSRYSMESLRDAVESSDFGAFVFAPDDVIKIRSQEFHVARDNVVFELGLFIGRLGKERCFLISPRGHEDLHLPTDLLGLTPATYEADRTDENLTAALGPACNRIRRTIERLGSVPGMGAGGPQGVRAEYDEKDCMSLIESWMGSRPSDLNTQAIRFADVDRELGLPQGSAETMLEEAAKRWNYRVTRRGNNTILFESTDR